MRHFLQAVHIPNAETGLESDRRRIQVLRAIVARLPQTVELMRRSAMDVDAEIANFERLSSRPTEFDAEFFRSAPTRAGNVPPTGLDQHMLGTRLAMLSSLSGAVEPGSGQGTLTGAFGNADFRPQFFAPSFVDYDTWLVPPEDKEYLSSPMSKQIEVANLLGKCLARSTGARIVVHPLVGFDPARQVRHGDALAVVRDAVAHKGAIGVKVYPPMGFRPLGNGDRNAGPFVDFLETAIRNFGARLDDALLELYAYCNDEDVPIMAHCSPSQGRGPGFVQRAAPELWRPVLDRFPKLRVNLAHFGGVAGEASPPRRGNEPEQAYESVRRLYNLRPQWAWTIATLMRDYPGRVYSDTGYFASVLNRSDWSSIGTLHQIFDAIPETSRYLMYGSDWNVVAAEERIDEYSYRLRGAMAPIMQDPVGRENFAWRNAARFFGLRTGDKARRRLEAVYRSWGVEPHRLDVFNPIDPKKPFCIDPRNAGICAGPSGADPAAVEPARPR
ncbi:amidohydrolase family protein [Roseomonas sp. CECT 9278]|uniref:amidohydrolase family protein n=1 Tax=Roseomonas sp. CECT 9278 TaxID=2845823 RepID=UPI001E38E31E|nr:amidohydrolase family protein [Roseomonas sp. CECT 9278]